MPVSKTKIVPPCYLQYGCGFDAPQEWLNFDASPILYFRQNWLLNLVFLKILRRKNPFPKNVRYGNILHGFKKLEGKCKAVYCSHILEHLTLEEFRKAVRNSRDLLETSGIFRLVVPSLEDLARNYLAGVEAKDPDAAIDFCRKSYMGREQHSRFFREAMKIHYFKNYHFWGWDYHSLEKELREAGFRHIRPARLGDSSLEIFKLVENPERFSQAVCVECVR